MSFQWQARFWLLTLTDRRTALIKKSFSPTVARSTTRYPNIDIVTATSALNLIAAQFEQLSDEVQTANVRKVMNFDDSYEYAVFDRLQNMGSAVTKSDGTVSFSGEIRCERRMDIVIGLPASGKSSALVEPISEMYKSRVIDSDEAKKLLPEYNDGWGAGVVHKESQRISEQQLMTALEKGENITYPRVSGDSTELLNIAAIAKSQGYSVYVHFNELDRNKALGRMINRFLETGRYIKPELITRYGNDINNTYEQAKKATSLVDGFSKWSNDVPIGSRPKLIEYSGSCEDIVRAFKPTLSERLEQSESNCRALRAKIDEVNDVFRKSPELSREYVKKRDELRAQKVMTYKTVATKKPTPPKPKR